MHKNVQSLLLTIISGMVFIFLTLPTRQKFVWLAVMLAGLLYLIFAKKLRISFKSVIHEDKKTLIISLFFEMVLGILFMPRWRFSKKLNNIVFTFINEENTASIIIFYLFLCAIGCVFCLLALPSIIKLFKFVFRNDFNCHFNQNTQPITQKINLKEILYLFIISFCTITVTSKCSFLYPFNDWVDSNCFFTVGKAWVNGMIPYRDIVEQKGPLLYALHSLAYLIDDDGFFAIYLVEILACFFVLFYASKIIRLYGKKNVEIPIVVFAVSIYGSFMFCHGDSAEELCLPFLMFGLYKGLQYIKSDYQLKIFPMAISIGIVCGLILWIKFTLLGFYVGWVLSLVIMIIHKKKWKDLFQLATGGITGALIVTIPVIIYFYSVGALKDLFKVYFCDNIFCYGGEASGLLGMINYLVLGIQKLTNDQFGTVICIFIGIICFINIMKRKEKFFILSTFVTTFFFAYFKNSTPYYGLPMGIFATFGLVTLTFFIKENFDNLKIKIIAVIMTIVFTYSFTTNRYLILAKQSEMPQFQFAEIIKKSDDQTLLNYGFLDGGFYTIAKVMPTTRYFCMTNSQYDEMYTEQQRYLKDMVTEFVVTRENINEEQKNKTEEHKAIDKNGLPVLYPTDPETFGNYECVATEDYTFENILFRYRLYQRK